MKSNLKKKKIKKLHWWQEFNWDAPIRQFDKWLIKNIKKILHKIGILIAIMLGVLIANNMPNMINDVIASYENEQELKIKAKEKIEQEAREREHRVQLQIQKQKEKAENDLQEKKQKEIERINAIETEIKDNFSKFDRVRITWWGLENGATPPKGCSSAGQITEIKGEYVYGTWGEFPIKWDECHFEKIDSKTMRDIKKKEKAHQELISKKENKSWRKTMSEDEKKIWQRKGVIWNLKK